MKSHLSASSSPILTCLSIDCPERFSLCCHAISERNIQSNSDAVFVCSKCKEPFVGGKCNAWADEPMMFCPNCKKEYIDNDGFGVLFCPKCGYCTHSSITGGICDFCKKEVEKEDQWWWKGWEIFKSKAFGRHPEFWHLTKAETILLIEKELIPKLLSLQKQETARECMKEFHVGRLRFMKDLFRIHGKQFEEGWRTARNFLVKQKIQYLQKNKFDF